MIRQQPVANLPGEDRRALALVLRHLGDHVVRGHPGLAAADGAGTNRPGFVVASENLADAAVGDLENARNIARSGAAVRQLDNALSGGVGQRPPVHEYAAELVHAAVAWNEKRRNDFVAGRRDVVGKNIFVAES